MLVRTVKCLSTSMLVGIVASAVSAVLAAIVGTAAAALPKGVDRLLGGCVDLTMGIPHIVLMILISFALGIFVTIICYRTHLLQRQDRESENSQENGDDRTH